MPSGSTHVLLWEQNGLGADTVTADAAPEPQHARVDYAITIERGARGAAAPFANLPLSAAIPKTLRLEVEILP